MSESLISISNHAQYDQSSKKQVYDVDLSYIMKPQMKLYLIFQVV
ncbi:MAG: hypothetical protein U9Q33_13460 [Campylobacterota bacterium]|nr:hypothetical protein [Campylobacterota bacterium]